MFVVTGQILLLAVKRLDRMQLRDGQNGILLEQKYPPLHFLPAWCNLALNNLHCLPTWEVNFLDHIWYLPLAGKYDIRFHKANTEIQKRDVIPAVWFHQKSASIISKYLHKFIGLYVYISIVYTRLMVVWSQWSGTCITGTAFHTFTGIYPFNSNQLFACSKIMRIFAKYVEYQQYGFSKTMFSGSER